MTSEGGTDKLLETETAESVSPSQSASGLSLVERSGTEPLEINTEPLHDEPSADFVKCTPSPHTSALSYLRRSSLSNAVSQQTKAVNSIPHEHIDSSTTAKGSAKKVRY